MIAQLTAFCGEDSSKWNAKKPAIDGVCVRVCVCVYARASVRVCACVLMVVVVCGALVCVAVVVVAAELGSFSLSGRAGFVSFIGPSWVRFRCRVAEISKPWMAEIIAK